MTKSEFQRAFDVACDRNVDLSDVSDEHLHGCGLPGFQRVTTTIAPVAKLIRWQCGCLNGSWDHEALQDMRAIARVKFELIGVGSDAFEDEGRRSRDTLRMLRELVTV